LRTAPIALPPVRTDGELSLESALRRRRSVRGFSPRPLTLTDVGQLLWAGQGVTGAGARQRTVPSAGGRGWLSLQVCAGDVEELAPGGYGYEPTRHELRRGVEGDQRASIEAHTIDGFPWLHEAPLILVIAGAIAPAAAEFGDQPPRGARGVRYVQIEVGHAAQSIALQATALGLGAVFVGGFDDDGLRSTLTALSSPHAAHEPLGLLVIGHPHP